MQPSWGRHPEGTPRISGCKRPSADDDERSGTKNPAICGVSVIVGGLVRTSANCMVVPKRGLEPLRPKPLPPQGSASTNSATWASVHPGHDNPGIQPGFSSKLSSQHFNRRSAARRRRGRLRFLRPDGSTVWASTQNPYSVRVELAKMFGSEASPKFVNGVLATAVGGRKEPSA